MRDLAVLTLSTMLVVVASACSSSDGAASGAAAAAEASSPAPNTNASGARLRARVITGGGAREVVGFHDSVRNEDCTFQRAEGGRMRCLPPLVPFYGESNVFADAACKLPVATYQASCDAAPKLAVHYVSSGSCPPEPTELRAAVPVGAARWAQQGSNACASQPAAPASTTTGAVGVGDVVAWTDFVEGKETVLPGEPISERVIVGDDGSRQHLGFRSDKLGASCNFETMRDDVTRCLPDTGRGPVLFGDPSCTQPLAVIGSTSCNASGSYWLDAVGASSCRDVAAVYATSPFHGPTTNDVLDLHQRSSTNLAECNPGSSYRVNTSSSDLRSIDADVTATLPAISRLGSGPSRLVPALVADADKPSLVQGFHDTERDVDCRFARASDGRMRCLPTGTAAKIFSTDAACKSPGHVAVLSEVTCTGFSGFAVEKSATCPETRRVLSLAGAPHDLTGGSTETAPGRCVSFPSLQKAYDATEADPTQFVEGLVATE